MSSPILWGPNSTANNLQNNFTQAGRYVGAGINIPWASNVTYSIGDMIINGSNNYYCIIANTSGSSFSSDFNAGYWKQIDIPIVGKNYVQVGSNFENNTIDGWELFTIPGYTAGSVPSVAPTLGSASSMTVAITSTNPLSGKYSLQVSNTATNNFTAGEGIISGLITIDSSDQAKVLALKNVYQATTGSSFQNYSGSSSNTWALYIYDVTNSAWVQPAGVYNFIQNSGIGQFSGTFQTNLNLVQFKIALLCINTTTGSSPAVNTIQTTFDDFYAGPQPFSMGPAMSSIASYVPTITGNVSNPTISGVGALQIGYWQRVGQNMKLWLSIQQGSIPGGGSGYYEFSIPSFAKINTNFVKTNSALNTTKGSLSTNGTPIGIAQINGVTNSGIGTVVASSDSKIAINFLAQTASTTALINNEFTFGAGGTNVYDFGIANLALNVFCEFPVVGWETNTSQSADTDTRVVSANVYKSNVQSIPSGVTGISILLNAITTDKTGMFDLANSRVKVNVSGIYKVTGIVTYAANATGGRSSVIKKNGTTIADLTIPAVSGLSVGVNNSTLIEAVSGDYFELFAYQNSGVALNTVAGANYTYLIVERLSGPAIVQATETVAASYSASGNSILNASWTTLSNLTQIFDTHQIFNSTTGIATIPVTGKYRISANVRFVSLNASISNFGIRIEKNLSASGEKEISMDIIPQASGSWDLLISSTLSLNAGDKIDIQVYNGNGATKSISSAANNNFIEIERIGN